MKTLYKEQAKKLTDIPNIGKAMERDFKSIGIHVPQDLCNKDPLVLYKQLCKAQGERQDPCVLDVCMAAVDFMNGAPARPWYFYTEERKMRYKL